jgi:hypothetical protein
VAVAGGRCLSIEVLCDEHGAIDSVLLIGEAGFFLVYEIATLKCITRMFFAHQSEDIIPYDHTLSERKLMEEFPSACRSINSFVRASFHDRSRRHIWTGAIDGTIGIWSYERAKDATNSFHIELIRSLHLDHSVLCFVHLQDQTCSAPFLHVHSDISDGSNETHSGCCGLLLVGGSDGDVSILSDMDGSVLRKKAFFPKRTSLRSGIAIPQRHEIWISEQGRIHIISSDTLDIICSIHAHSGQILSFGLIASPPATRAESTSLLDHGAENWIVVTSSWDSSIALWDCFSRTLITKIDGAHTSSVRSITFFPPLSGVSYFPFLSDDESVWLSSGGQDGIIHIWRFRMLYEKAEIEKGNSDHRNRRKIAVRLGAIEGVAERRKSMRISTESGFSENSEIVCPQCPSPSPADFAEWKEAPSIWHLYFPSLKNLATSVLMKGPDLHQSLWMKHLPSPLQSSSQSIPKGSSLELISFVTSSPSPSFSSARLSEEIPFSLSAVGVDAERSTHPPSSPSSSIRTSSPCLSAFSTLSSFPCEDLVRPSLWLLWSGALYLQHRHTTSYYACLVKQANYEMQKEKNSSFRQIEKDVLRSFAESTQISVEEREKHSALLRRILSAYALHNPVVGYCQSMNIISAFLTSHVPEEDTFWLLSAICQIIPDNYSMSMVGGGSRQKVMASLVREYLPEVSAFLDPYLLVESLTFKWFMCLFVNYLSDQAMLRLFDCFFFSGRVVLYQVALAFFVMNEEKILKLSSPMEISHLADDIDEEELFHVAFRELRSVTREKILSLESEALYRHLLERHNEEQEWQRKQMEKKRREEETKAQSSAAAKSKKPPPDPRPGLRSTLRKLIPKH